jgi:hypothetical protein
VRCPVFHGAIKLAKAHPLTGVGFFYVRLVVEKKIKATKNLRQSPFEKYSGIRIPRIPCGRKAIIRWVRAMRGQ